MQKPALKAGMKKAQRAAFNPSAMNLVQMSYVDPDKPFPLVIQPTMPGVNLATWVQNNKASFDQELNKHGAILFRNFTIDSPAKFEELAHTASDTGELFDEYGDLPREALGTKIYHSTPYPADKSILFHNESSHMHRWPMKIMFYGVKTAESGGATPILDCHKTYAELDPAIINRFAEKKLMYVRNFIEKLDISWQQFFQTENKQKVEEYCQKAAMDFEWVDETHLRIRKICPAVVKHPYTGKMLFFNQIQLHHVACLAPEVRDSMFSVFKEEDLPRNVYFGDGTPIEDSLIADISAFYDQNAVRFTWQAGDVVILDNMRVAHARNPFVGTRKVLVAMADIVYQNSFH